MLTHREMIRLLSRRMSGSDQENLLVRDIMQPDPPTATPEMSLAGAILDMQNLKTDCLPVVVGQRLVGILTLRDLVKWAAKNFDRKTRARGASR